MSVKISIIIPVYKVEKYLPACLDSALQQEFDSFEVVAVNDGSPDACGDILAEYGQRYPHLKVITQENRGLGGARNTGIAASEGDFLLFLDSDDTLAAGALAFLYDQAQRSDADMVCFGMNYVAEDGRILSTYRALDGGVRQLTSQEYLIHFANNSYAWNKFYRASLFKGHDIRFPSRAWYEDLATIPKIVLQSQTIVLTDRVFYNYLQRGDSIMHLSHADRVAEMLDAVEDVLNYYKQNGAFDAYFETLEYLTVLHVLVLATNRVASIDPTHPLLRQFYDYTLSRFPNFRKNAMLKTHLPRRRKMIYALPQRKLYRALFWLNKLNNLR